jgi:guanylate kinase
VVCLRQGQWIRDDPPLEPPPRDPTQTPQPRYHSPDATTLLTGCLPARTLMFARLRMSPISNRRMGHSLKVLGTAFGGAVAAGTVACSSLPTVHAGDRSTARIGAVTAAGVACGLMGGPLAFAAFGATGVASVITATESNVVSRAVVIAGPSGVGKGTLIEMLMKDMPGKFGFSVSHATRKPRPGEVNGTSYHFVTVPGMEAAIAKGEFIEYANVHGNYYGTSKKSVADVCEAGQVCLLDIDIQGVQSVSKAWSSTPPPLYIFIKPTSDSALEKRLRGRVRVQEIPTMLPCLL